MRRYLAALLLIAARGCLGGILEDYPDKITVCHSLDCARGVADKYTTSGELIVLTVTYSVEYDGYLPLYCGWLFEMLEKVPFHLVYFDIARMLLGSDVTSYSADAVVDISNGYVANCSACEEAPGPVDCPHCASFDVLKTVAFLFNPKRLAIVIIKDAEFRMEICNYRSIRNANRLGVPIVIHLNDEMPWAPPKVCALDVVLGTYSAAPIALRNYYYDTTNVHALYYPLGAGKLSYNNKLKTNAFLAELPMKPSSNRTFICAFAGRMKYKESFSDGEGERAELMQVLSDMQGSESPACYAVFSDMNSDYVAKHGMDFNTYFNVMRESIFAPCPGGNNPETFRHYEALELGTIPLLVRIKRPERDFLSTWVGYPGPIFESWAELGPFLKSINGSYANALQKKVVDWYAAFKNSYKERIADRISRAISPAEGLPPPSATTSGAAVPDAACGSCCEEQSDLIAALREEIAGLSARVRALERNYQ